MFPCPGPSSFPQSGAHFRNLPVLSLPDIFSLSSISPLLSSHRGCGVTSFFTHICQSQCIKVQDGSISSDLFLTSVRVLQRNNKELVYEVVGPGESEICTAGWLAGWLATQVGASASVLRQNFYFLRKPQFSSTAFQLTG